MTAKDKIRDALGAEWRSIEEIAALVGIHKRTARDIMPELMRAHAVQRRRRKGAPGGQYEYCAAYYRGAITPRPYRTGMVWWSTAWG
jgi:predicted transcriptional regulator